MLTEADVTELQRLKRYAESHVVSKVDVEKMARNELAPVGDNPLFRSLIGDMRVVYSVMEADGLYRRVSISAGPSCTIQIGNGILEQLGFHKNDETTIWTESDARFGRIVNAIQKCDRAEVLDGNKLLRPTTGQEQVQSLPT